MMHHLTNLCRPGELDALQKELVELALGGRASCSADARGWLVRIGVVTERNVADKDWLDCTLPCPSEADLLTRTLLRDPLYRLHVDLLLVEIVAAIGASARWTRLEELVFGDLAELTPRFASLIKILPRHNTLHPMSRSACDPIQGEAARVLDERCWGISGNAETMFPVLRARYPAYGWLPVFFEPTSPIAVNVTAAATEGQAVLVPEHVRDDLVALMRVGCPLWWRASSSGTLEVTLSGPCRLRASTGQAVETRPFSRGVPSPARAGSRLLEPTTKGSSASFWEIAESLESGLAFVGTTGRETWPADDVASRRGLPSGEALSGLIRARHVGPGGTDEADEALRKLSDHPLFGFWLQALLVEALDRELGTETILFAPPVHALVEDLEASTRIYYRPRPDAENRSLPLLELGALGDVMTRVSIELGIYPVAALGDVAGPWEMSLGLLAQVGVVQTRHDRWALSTHALDRLHGGGLMTSVLRRGRGFREQLHDVFKEAWNERIGSAHEVGYA